MSTDRTPNIPLLRKALAWAEAEAAKPPDDRQWHQQYWRLTPREAYGRDMTPPTCGTTYCLFGWVCYLSGKETDEDRLADGHVYTRARNLLGIDIDTANRLSADYNTIEDLRHLAEEIAASVGETL
ncbi:MAG: hypothetical protein ACRDP1_02415 [Nocardioidaceae bacterium]